jgi:type IV pilus assembly protein PilQ
MCRAPTRTVMRSLAEYSGSNIVVGKEVLGNVTVNLTEVPGGRPEHDLHHAGPGLGGRVAGSSAVETLENLRKRAVARSTADKQLEDLQPLSTQIVRAVRHGRRAEPAIERR